MKKFTLGVLTLGSLVLAGCSSDETVDPEESITVRAVATYVPAESNIPVPNDLLFSGTADLTLNIPVADPQDFSDPQNAISSLDGWSTVAPFSFSFQHEDDTVTLDASSVAAGSTVRVFEVLADTDFNNPLFGDAPTFAPYDLVGEVPATEYAVSVQGMDVVVIPTKPLNPRSTYVVLATNGIMDSNGVNVTKDAQYDFVSSGVELTGSLAALEPVRQLVNTYENLAAAGGVNKDNIVISFAFTTQSVGPVVQAAKGLYVDFPFSQGQFPATDFTPLNIPSNMVNPALSGEALISVGEISLNYMLSAPTMENPTAPLNSFWRGAEMVPGPNGGMVPNPMAGGFTTYVNKLPQVNGIETVPLLVSLPSNVQCPKPYPVMIFQHGITSNRTAMLGIADAMASVCTAIVSMDLPLHGVNADNGGIFFTGYDSGDVRERTFGVDYVDNGTSAPGPDSMVDSSGAHFINLPNLLVSRDNIRQAIFDLLTLEKAIPAMDVDGDTIPDFDSQSVSFMGHSLGGIVGSSFVAYSDLVQTSVLANPGGGIAGLLDASDTFGPVVRGGVAAGAGIPTTDPAFPALYQQFLFAAQTVIDSGDPINTTMAALGNDIPTLMLRNEGDSVVPNNSPTAPLSGTDPLAAYLQLAPVTAENPGDLSVGERQISRINDGLHSTVLTPAGPEGATQYLNVTTEMQTHIVSFITSDGAAVQVADPTLLD
ncbi:hypothetical protein [Pleionea mediterranea]|uniref:Virulence factor lipase-like protein n=1 Tax=Pleionea mediterranea TaxID=523701 RepID=A0A316G449_9GAMM|nr:hypothetical protein [Pleionea mediterranea]PWK54560.1 virulence factor lipase-like protein [Pleionea mediterranea]